MSLSGVLNNALSGINASSAGLRTASNNVANVNTPGYARTLPNIQSRNVGGTAMGVEVLDIKRVVDKFLQVASVKAISQSGDAQIQAAVLDRLQAQFGGLDDTGSMFSRLNMAFEGISQASVDPTLSVARLSAVSDLQAFFDETERLSIEIRAQRLETDSRITTALSRGNEILNELFQLNTSVQSLSSRGGDITGAANRQSELLDELAGIMDIQTEHKTDNRIVIRTGDGVLLVDTYAVKLEYVPGGSGAYEINFGGIVATPPSSGAPQQIDGHILSGELRGLLDLRDTILPAIAEELAELTAGAADALNAAHNNSASYPAKPAMIGRNTGLDGADGHNFTGSTTLAVTDTTGLLVKRVDIDFTAGTLSVDGGGAVGIGATVASLTAAINGALGGDGTATFTNGALTISTTNAGTGVSTLDDPITPSSRGGRGFSHFFGLNDLVTASRPAFFQTGLSGTEAHNYGAGTELKFEIRSPGGNTAQTITIPVVAGQTFNSIIGDLNNAVTGLGRYVNYNMDTDGQLNSSIVPGYDGFTVSLVSDDTSRTGSAVSFSNMFGIGLQSKAGRSEIFEVDPTIRSNSDQLSLAQLDITGASVVGDVVLASGDGRGGQLLQAVNYASRTFETAGSLIKSTSTLQNFAARFAGSVGARSARAASEAMSAEVLMQTAQGKRADVEGVNLDEELAAMTMYQQSYNASARMLQAAKEMTDALLNII